MDKQSNVLLGVVGVVFAMVLFPIAGYAAAEASDTTSDTQSAPPAVLNQAVEAGKAVVKRALSSKEKSSNVQAPAVTETSEIPGKAVSVTATLSAKTAAAVHAAGSLGKVPETKAASDATLSSFAGKKAAPLPQTKIKKTWEEKLPDPDPEVEKLEGAEKIYEGVVSGAGFNGIAVVPQKLRANAPNEKWFNYVKGLRLSGVAKLSELQAGDMVKVFYKETKDGRRFLTGITLIRKAPEAPAEEVQEEEKA